MSDSLSKDDEEYRVYFPKLQEIAYSHLIETYYSYRSSQEPQVDLKDEEEMGSFFVADMVQVY